GQDRENISKTSAMPHDSTPRVTSLGGDEGSLQQKLNELMDFCTTLQSQHTQMAAKIQSQDLEISQLKTRIKALENAQNIRGDVQEDAPNRGGSMDQREEFGIERDSNKSTKKGNESTEEMANVLSSMGAANILASGGLKEVVTTASPQVATTSLQVAPASTTDTPVALASVIDTPVVATASERTSTAVTSTTTRAITSYTKRTRSSRGIIFESSQPSHQTSTTTFSSKEEEFPQENQSLKEQVARDAEISRIQAEEDLRQMINELDRSNEVVNKHMAEYEQAEHDLTLEEKIDLIKVLLNYQKNLIQVKKYQAQQSKLDTKTERRKFYMAMLRSHAGWKSKDFKGMTFEQIEEKFTLV
ncbi:hypothetical protein Tco_1383022, partial [Tanacetum coccineum]